MSEDYLTSKEAAALLRIKERRLYDLVRDGSLPGTRASGRWLFPRQALEKLLGGEQAAPNRPPVVAGSHDPLLEWALRESGSGLALLAEGSMAGLEDFFAGKAVMATTHLPDNKVGESGNVAAIAGRAKDAVLIGWSLRRQGLVLPAGNPKGVKRLADLAERPLARRQDGAGSHGLLLALWREAGLAEDSLHFAPGIARTQMELGLMVLEGRAEAGLAAEAAARSLKLDFLTLAQERFDLLISRRDYFEPPVQKLFAFAHSQAFREKAAALGGYDLAPLGLVRWNAP